MNVTDQRSNDPQFCIKAALRLGLTDDHLRRIFTATSEEREAAIAWAEAELAKREEEPKEVECRQAHSFLCAKR
jgi:hypothetical protein